MQAHHDYPDMPFVEHHQQQQHPQQQHQPHRLHSPSRNSYLTVDTVVSADYFSDNTGSTALTSPSLHSPKFPWGAKRHSHQSGHSGHSLEDIQEALETRPLGLSPPPPTAYATSFSGEDSSTMYSQPYFEVHQTSRPASFHAYNAPEASHDNGDNRNNAYDAGVADATPGFSSHHMNTEQDYTERDYQDDPQPGLAPTPEDVRRGPSVRSRASEYEASLDTTSQALSNVTHESDRGRLTLNIPPPTTTTTERPRSVSPRLRLPPSPGASPSTQHFALNGPPSPSPVRTAPRSLPVPPGQDAFGAQPRALPVAPASPTPIRGGGSAYLNESPTGLSRTANTTRRMISAWENGTPLAQSPTDAHAVDNGLFPLSAGPSPPHNANSPMRWSLQANSRMPVNGITVPSPLAVNDPLAAASPPSLSASTWSQQSAGGGRKRKNQDLSPCPTGEPQKTSPRRSPFKRSPFKEIANVVKGFRNKNKKADENALEQSTSRRSFVNLDEDSDWFAQPKPVSTVPAGLLGERMAEDERRQSIDVDAIRTDPVVYLAPQPEGPSWNTWVTCWATLTPTSLKITHAPLKQGTDSPVSRTQMNLATAYSQIPRPEIGAPAMVELPMMHCVEVRALRKDEVRGRRIPAAPEGVGTEVLELDFADGSREYLGVEGVAGRLGWVSAIWDVVLASKKKSPSLHPPSPSQSSLRNMMNPLPLPQGSHDLPAQKMGDQWIKSGPFVGESASVQNTPELSSAGGSGFRPPSRFPSLDEHMDVDNGYMGSAETHQEPVLQKQEPMFHVPDSPDAPGLRDLPPVERAPPKPEGMAVDFDPVLDDLYRPNCTLPLTINKRSAPTSPNVANPPPLPPKREMGSLVEERRRAWANQGQEPAMRSVSRMRVPTPTKVDPTTVPEPHTPERRGGVSLPRTEPQGLRESLVKMFDQDQCPASEDGRRRLRSKTMEDRIRAWQSKGTGEDPSAPLSRNTSTREQESLLSFDDSDLNPSRSASQVRKTTTNSSSVGLGAASEGRTLTGLGLGLGLDLDMARILPAAPMRRVSREPPARFEQATIEEVPTEIRRFAVTAMPKPSRVLAARSTPGTPQGTQGPEPPRDRTKSTSNSGSATGSSTPLGPRAGLPKVSSRPRTPVDDNAPAAKPASSLSATNSPMRLPKVSSKASLPKVASNSNLPKVASNSNLPKVAGNSNLPKVPSNSSLPKVSSNSNLPKTSSNASLPKTSSNASLPSATSIPNLTSPPAKLFPASVSTVSTESSAPPVPAKDTAKDNVPLPTPTSLAPKSPTPRLQSRVLAAASVFEPTIAQRTLNNLAPSSTPSPAKRRKAVPKLELEDVPKPVAKDIFKPLQVVTPGASSGVVSSFEALASAGESTKVGTASAVATGSRVNSSVGAAPTKAFPKAAGTPPRSAVSTHLSTPRSALTPRKIEIIPKSPTNVSPYLAARAALRPTPGKGSSVSVASDKATASDKDASKLSSVGSPVSEKQRPERPGWGAARERPLGLYVVNKTPEEAVTARMTDNPAAKLPRAAIDVDAVERGSTVSTSTKLSIGRSEIATPSALGWKSVASITNLDQTEVRSEVTISSVKSTRDMFEAKSKAASHTPSVLSTPLPSSPLATAKERERHADPPRSETWFRDRASCGEAENEDARPAPSAVTAAPNGEEQGEEEVEAVQERGLPPMEELEQSVVEYADVRSDGVVETVDTSGLAPVMERMKDQSAEHYHLSRQIDGVSMDVTNVAVGMSTLTAMVREQNRTAEIMERFEDLKANFDEGLTGVREAVQTLPAEDIVQRLEAIGTDVRDVQTAMKEGTMAIAALTAAQAVLDAKKGEESGEKDLPAPPEDAAPPEAPEPKIPEVHAKLDAIAHLIQEVLARQADLAKVTAAIGADVVAKEAVAADAPKEASKEADAPKEKEAAKPPAVAATPAATPEVPKEAKDAPKDAPKEAPKDAPKEEAKDAPPEPATAAQLADVQNALKELESARAVQAQQTADIARYLADLNGWLEKFVQNSGSELEGMSRKINNLVGEPGEDEVPTGLVADIHTMLAEQAQQVNIAALQAQRLDSLLGFMGADRERHAQQQGMIEQLLAAAEKQREDTAGLLQAIAVDLTEEIKGERVRFIDSMREATSMNIANHVNEFKAALATETQRSLKELGMMREQKKVLEHQIADLFALKAKHSDEPPHSPSVPDRPQAPPTPAATPVPRLLPVPPQ